MKEIITKQVKNTKDEREIIKIIHDYIINNTKYDSDKSDRNIEKYNSNIAYGPLLQGYGLCGGYTDAMAIFLDYYDIPNYKVISENHIWNAVYLNNKCGRDTYNKLINNDKVRIYLNSIKECGLIDKKIYNPVSGDYFNIDNEYVDVTIDEVGVLDYKLSF